MGQKQQDTPHSRERRGNHIGLGIAIATWTAIGLAVGVAVGAALNRLKKAANQPGRS